MNEIYVSKPGNIWNIWDKSTKEWVWEDFEPYEHLAMHRRLQAIMTTDRETESLLYSEPAKLPRLTYEDWETHYGCHMPTNEV